MFTSKAYEKATEAHEKATLALAKINHHEEECAKRYNNILDMLKENTAAINGQFKMLVNFLLAIGGAIVLGLFTLIFHLLSAKGVL